MIEPRFPGGTSSAVAAELEAIHSFAKIEVHGIKTAMFPNNRISPRISDVIMRLGIPFFCDSVEISADIVIFHNPSCLKFQDSLNIKLIARHLIVVTHENFLRPGSAPGFDVEKCLSMITSASLVMSRSLAPISRYNRLTVQDWKRMTGTADEWAVLPDDWFNICAQTVLPPAKAPRDRRGRLSRPGFEKFPSRDMLEICFPKHAESNVILGADHLMEMDDTPGHWTLHPFGTLALDQFFDLIDFFVYYTSPTWRESFGRVIAEAIAAGKVVITDEQTATAFEGAAVGAPANEVSGIISEYLADPDRYAADVKQSQAALAQYSATMFQKMFSTVLTDHLVSA